MGIFSVTLEVGNPDGGDRVGVSAVVDTGAAHTMLPASLLAHLQIQPVLEKSFGFANGGAARLGVGLCRIALQDEQFDCPVIFGPEDQYLLGATTLEIFDLAVEPVAQTLVPRIHYERPYF